MNVSSSIDQIPRCIGRLLILVISVLSPQLHACSFEARLANKLPASADCKVLLRAVIATPYKSTWANCAGVAAMVKLTPDLNPAEIYEARGEDPAWCALLDPADQDLNECLIGAITDTTPRDETRCPRFTAQIAVGDLAFFALGNRFPGLWQKLVPAGDAWSFRQWIGEKGRRQRLQADVRDFVEQAEKVD